MSAYTFIFLLCVSSIEAAVENRAGFAEEYLNTNYTPMIRQTHYMVSKQVDSKDSCPFECLRENDCSLIVFNQSNYQCMIYNIYPVIDQELLPDNNIIVYVFQQTIERKEIVVLFL
jgi:hypothetical protein